MKWMHLIKQLKILKSKEHFYWFCSNKINYSLSFRYNIDETSLDPREKAQVNIDHRFIRQS